MARQRQRQRRRRSRVVGSTASLESRAGHPIRGGPLFACKEKTLIRFDSGFLDQVRKFNEPSIIERCGLIFRQDSIVAGHSKIAEAANVNKRPTERFSISHRQARDLLNKFGSSNFVAVFHTHIKPSEVLPSQHDLGQLAILRKPWPELVGIVYNVPLGLLVEYSTLGPMRKLLLTERNG